jgi:hypothetical protein
MFTLLCIYYIWSVFIIVLYIYTYMYVFYYLLFSFSLRIAMFFLGIFVVKSEGGSSLGRFSQIWLYNHIQS